MNTRHFTHIAMLFIALALTIKAQSTLGNPTMGPTPTPQIVQVYKIDFDSLRQYVPITPGVMTMIQCWVYERGDDQRKYTISFRYQDKDGVHTIMQVVPTAPWGTAAFFPFPTTKATDIKMLSISVAYGDSQQPTTATEQPIEDNNHVGVQ